MLDIGFLELMLIGIVGLLVLGPERLPRAARTTGLWVGKIKRTISGMQREISAQLEAEELRQTLKDQQKSLNNSLKKAKQEVESIAEPSSPAASKATAQVPKETERRVAQASAQLDDALQEVNDTPPESASSETPATSHKDSNHP
ncbi:Sec-independent protein translocase protein TatB [Vreelandella populi]|uniref:Sec-independent protein translocase protein TatB n=1 Tax=Vreelandella populi TaxID=2498858 RepID=A0A3S0YL27_9GAMM|nr:Sec-independent protein translocase protein TatB [Halomonas populi]RUR36959.1 twin-arginine translocase subunit TatB [Halomonas populi]RUR44070.1 twin-arginine translocase subunit TatB [Halomonas populi]RUR53527.1 twin-arginine translocase subunit TatB [Halomonas populi]